MKYKTFENSVGKGEIARNKQFLLFPQYFYPVWELPAIFIKFKFMVCKRQILDLSKLKPFADDNFKFHENGRKFFRRVENTVGKGEIARYEQFLLFPQCFQKACVLGASKGVIVWEWDNPLLYHLWLLTVLRKRALENIVGKGEMLETRKSTFLLSPQCFLHYQWHFPSYE